jgi:hypothetical protein
MSKGMYVVCTWKFCVNLTKATVGITNAKNWRFYDHGDLSKAPVICLPPAGGSADVFFRLFNQLPDKGIRLIAVI